MRYNPQNAPWSFIQNTIHNSNNVLVCSKRAIGHALRGPCGELGGEGPGVRDAATLAAAMTIRPNSRTKHATTNCNRVPLPLCSADLWLIWTSKDSQCTRLDRLLSLFRHTPPTISRPPQTSSLSDMATPGALTNVTSFLPSPADLLMVFPRLYSKASALGDLLRAGGSVIAEPTLANQTNTTVATTAGKFIQESIAAAASAASDASVTPGTNDEISMFQAIKNVAAFFSYITSKWAIATFAFVSWTLPNNALTESLLIRTTGDSLKQNSLLRI